MIPNLAGIHTAALLHPESISGAIITTHSAIDAKSPFFAEKFDHNKRFIAMTFPDSKGLIDHPRD